MNDWNLFPFWEPRPDVPKFAVAERSVLEDLVARQVADLLALYATIDDVELDQSACAIADEAKTYRVLDLDPLLLEDDGELQVHQMPLLNGEYVVTAGCHGVSKEDQDGLAEFEAVIWDPALNISPNVITPAGEPIGISILQELYEGLIVASGITAELRTIQTPPNDTAAFPMSATELDFEAIISSF